MSRNQGESSKGAFQWRGHSNVKVLRISKLLEVNKKTGIDSRGLIAPFGQPLWEDKASPPSIEQTDAFFRKYATQLAVGSCRKAIKEWGGQITDITHAVAVTCTNAGSPGFDQEVVAQIGLPLYVDKTRSTESGVQAGSLHYVLPRKWPGHPAINQPMFLSLPVRFLAAR